MGAIQYSIIIRKGVFDGETCFEASVVELPDVAEYGDSYEEALELAIDTIETTEEIFAKKAYTKLESDYTKERKVEINIRGIE